MIQVQNLCKNFGAKKAVNDVSFTVNKGEVLGFLGPNGAGKSTTMRMITGYIPPTSGKVTIGEYDIVDQPIQAKKFIGYLPENAPSYSDMTVRGFLGFTAEVRGLSGTEKEAAIRKAVETCFLEPVLHQSIETLSKGFRHRTCLAQSILHDPEVLILDEPTDGLDPNQKQEVRNLIRKMSEKKAIILSTHILEEVEAVCSRVIIIDRGTIVANGTPQELKQQSETAGVIMLNVPAQSATEVSSKVSGLAAVSKVDIQNNGRGSYVRIFPRQKGGKGALASEIFHMAFKEGWQIEDIQTEEGRLDDVFRRITLPDTKK